MTLTTKQYRGWAIKFTQYTRGHRSKTFACHRKNFTRDGPVVFTTRREARGHIKRMHWTKIAEAVKVFVVVREDE